MKLIISILALLVLAGLLVLTSASSGLGLSKFNDPYYYVKHQIIYGLPLGLLGFLFFYSLSPTALRRLALPFLLAGIVLLILVFTPLGFHSGGADRWIKAGPITFQPSEFLKIGFVLYIAAWLAKTRERSRAFLAGFLPFFIVLAIIAGLLLKQPATSTMVILMITAFSMYFASGARFLYVLAASVAGILILSLIIYFTPYRRERIMNFLNPDENPETTGYQRSQAETAIGAGGLFGAGFGKSIIKTSLPEPVGDSIFAVLAEEIGFAGVLVLLALFTTLIIATLRRAARLRDKFSQLTLVGFAALIGIQVFVHIGANTGLLPVTGIPLPFVSFGGTSLAVFISIGGILTRLTR